MQRNFSAWFSTFRESIATYSYYVDFRKVYSNVESIKVELNILNSLINSKNIKSDFEEIIIKYPETLKCIPILLAVRNLEIPIMDDAEFLNFNFLHPVLSTKEYAEFMDRSGLFDLLQNHLINNLIDYVTGVETGLDKKKKKNRGGHLMEDLVESYIQKAGFQKNINYFKEMYVSEISKKWKVDLSAVSNKGKVEKRFDFVVKTNKQIYVVEANFYGSSGSKLNETARSYKTLSTEIDTIDGVSFVWFTDGKGWINARNNLEETFDVMEHIYCIEDMKKGIISKIFK